MGLVLGTLSVETGEVSVEPDKGRSYQRARELELDLQRGPSQENSSGSSGAAQSPSLWPGGLGCCVPPCVPLPTLG